MNKKQRRRWKAVCCVVLASALALTSIGLPGGSIARAEEETETMETIDINETFTVGLCEYRKIGLGKAQLVDGMGLEGDVVVPASVVENVTGETYQVTEIGPKAFYQNTEITSLDFSQTQITKIGD